MLGLERGDHFIAFAIKHRDLLRVAGHRRQPLQASQNILLKGADFRFDIAGLAGLAEADIDLHQVVQGFQIAPQRQAAAQQVETLQFDARALEFAVGVTHQIEVGHQHRHQEQYADQAELHAEAQAIHQCDSGIEQALHWMSPFNFLFFLLAGADRQQIATIRRYLCIT
ncbi:hypothetical protein D3C81_1784880 [compost metagenome]